MSRRILFLTLVALLTLELYQISSYFPVKAEGVVREDVFTQFFKRDLLEKEKDVKGVYVKYGDEIEYALVNASSVDEALEKLGYEIGRENRIVTNSPEGILLNNSIIIVQTYRLVVQEGTFTIPFETITKGTPLCARLATKILEQEGVVGEGLQEIELLYLEDELIEERITRKKVLKEAVPQIYSYSTNHTPTSVTNYGANCNYWNTVVDTLSATDEEKRWLKFTMKGESGCNAESDRGYYKGLFQWNPCLWYSLYPNDNIFDGDIQIKRTLQKIREGANPKNMWPGVYKMYVAQYGELSWLQ